MKVFADKMFNTLEKHREEIARGWCKAVRKNPRTLSFDNVPEEECFKRAIFFYKNLEQLYFSEKPYTEVQDYFSDFAETAYGFSIPLHEALYGIIMMRRHMWLYTEFQAPFLNAMDHYQAVATINKTIRIFDHGIYAITKKYGELKGQ